ncbi:myosin heavy chain, striated muscle [Heracleum sosnowskyi]|uniref:Myosin heavy chain, striated muscle n=1 Tax=Heracleum sosnowskyi TaxID=360622 RepID=A0AAD8MGV7_9APIA|nr:myosin heavy chain, striated muscle [Heracleum sosnowskyi]
MNIIGTRTQSYQDLGDSVPASAQQYDDSALEGVAANVKLLLKLIQDHKDACKKGQKDSRRMLRVAGMMTVLDNVRDRIKKCQSFGNKSSQAELRRCNTDVKANPPQDKKSAAGIADDEKERLRKDLNASLAARKRLEVICSSIGKEKEIMAAELARKNYELSELEEHSNDLREQNRTLLWKVRELAAEREYKTFDNENSKAQGSTADLQARNKALSEQLLRYVDGYRSMKRNLREIKEEAIVMRETVEEMSEKVAAGLEHVRALKQEIQTESDSDQLIICKEGTSEVEHVFECLEMLVSKHGQRKM